MPLISPSAGETPSSRPARWPLLALLIAVPFGTPAAFDLFNPNRGDEPAPKVEHKPAPEPKRKPVSRALKTEQFVLRGTSRIGDRYHVVLEHVGGKEMRIPWREGRTSPIDGFPGYELLSVSPRVARIGFPEKSMCLEDDLDKGIYCSAIGDSARLVLVRRTPTAAPKPPVKAGNKPKSATTGGSPPSNPFQAALEKARSEQQGGAAPAAQAMPRTKAKDDVEATRERLRRARSNFKPKKIDPDDVPEGMKVVHTPFGDRLVPKR